MSKLEPGSGNFIVTTKVISAVTTEAKISKVMPMTYQSFNSGQSRIFCNLVNRSVSMMSELILDTFDHSVNMNTIDFLFLARKEFKTETGLFCHSDIFPRSTLGQMPGVVFCPGYYATNLTWQLLSNKFEKVFKSWLYAAIHKKKSSVVNLPDIYHLFLKVFVIWIPVVALRLKKVNDRAL